MNRPPPQLETGVAGPVKVFKDSLIVNIPRSRFLPVKKTCDLMLVMSNLYTLDKGTLIMSPDRVYQTTPVVELGDEHFKKVCCLVILTLTSVSTYCDCVADVGACPRD